MTDTGYLWRKRGLAHSFRGLRACTSSVMLRTSRWMADGGMHTGANVITFWTMRTTKGSHRNDPFTPSMTWGAPKRLKPLKFPPASTGDILGNKALITADPWGTLKPHSNQSTHPRNCFFLKSWRCSPMCFSRSFVLLVVRYRSTLHLKLFLCMVKTGDRDLFVQWGCPVIPAPSIDKMLLFPLYCFGTPVEKPLYVQGWVHFSILSSVPWSC